MGVFRKKAEAPHIKLGRIGERTAARFLAAEGMEILFRDLKLNEAQIDIIARDGETFVFVEVKTRKARGFTKFSPERDLHPAQMDRILNAVSEFRKKYHTEQFPVRCDYMEIQMGRFFPVKIIRHENWFSHKTFRKKKGIPFSLKPAKIL